MDVKDNIKMYLKPLYCSTSSYTHCELFSMSIMSYCSVTTSEQLFQLYHGGNKLIYILIRCWRLSLQHQCGSARVWITI